MPSRKKNSGLPNQLRNLNLAQGVFKKKSLTRGSPGAFVARHAIPYVKKGWVSFFKNLHGQRYAAQQKRRGGLVKSIFFLPTPCL